MVRKNSEVYKKYVLCSSYYMHLKLNVSINVKQLQKIIMFNIEFVEHMYNQPSKTMDHTYMFVEQELNLQ